MTTMSPIAIAQLFHITCITIMDHFIACGRQDCLLGPISHCYGVMEINCYGILHLYYMLWLSENLDLVDIRIWLLEDKVYISRIIINLDTIISCWVDEVILLISILSKNQYINSSVHGCESDFDWLELINYNNNVVAII